MSSRRGLTNRNISTLPRKEERVLSNGHYNHPIGQCYSRQFDAVPVATVHLRDIRIRRELTSGMVLRVAPAKVGQNELPRMTHITP